MTIDQLPDPWRPVEPAPDPAELVVSREITPLIDQARQLVPLGEIASVNQTMKTYVIHDEEGERAVNEYMRQSKTWTDTLSEFWSPKKSFWFRVHRACCAAETETAPDIPTIRKNCEKAMKDWLKRKSEAYYIRQREIEAATEQQRREQAKEAKRAALSGDVAKAEQLKQSADQIRAPVIIQGPTKLEGTAVKPTFTAKCVSPRTLIEAVAEGKIPLMHKISVRGAGETEVPLLVVNEAVLRHYAAKMGTHLNWPGVTVEQDVSFAARKL